MSLGCILQSLICGHPVLWHGDDKAVMIQTRTRVSMAVSKARGGKHACERVSVPVCPLNGSLTGVEPGCLFNRIDSGI